MIGVDSGWEIYVAGNGGHQDQGRRSSWPRSRPRTRCWKYSGAFLQLYREEGWYLERMYKWCDRVGLDAIRKQVVEDVANRKALFERFAYSQQFSQSDPWAERAQRGVDRNEFAPMAELELA